MIIRTEMPDIFFELKVLTIHLVIITVTQNSQPLQFDTQYIFLINLISLLTYQSVGCAYILRKTRFKHFIRLTDFIKIHSSNIGLPWEENGAVSLSPYGEVVNNAVPVLIQVAHHFIQGGDGEVARAGQCDPSWVRSAPVHRLQENKQNCARTQEDLK